MPSITAPPPPGGSITQCVTELGVNLGLMLATGQSDDATNRAALLEQLAGPFRAIVQQVRDIIMGENGIVETLKSIAADLIPTSLEQLLQMMKDAPTRLVGGIINSVDTLASQLWQYGSAEVGQVMEQVKKIIQGLIFFNPETIIGMAYQALTLGLPSIFLQKKELKLLRKLTYDIKQEVAAGNIPKQINPKYPFTEADHWLCMAGKEFKSVEDELLEKNTFNKGHCSTGTGYIKKARDTLISGGNSVEFLKDFGTQQLGIAGESISDFASRKWMPPIEVGLKKEGIIALIKPIAMTNNNIKTLHDNLASLTERLNLNLKFENLLVLFIRFIENEIARNRNALLAATGDPTGTIQQLKNNRNQILNEYSLAKQNPFNSQAKIREYEDRLKSIDAQIKDLEDKKKGQSPETYNPGTILDTMAAQLEVAIGLTILAEIARAICTAMDKLEKIFSKITSLSGNSIFKQFNDILDKFDPTKCPEFAGNKVLCNIGKFLDALYERATLKTSDDGKLLRMSDNLLKSINEQLKYLDCLEDKILQSQKDLLPIITAIGLIVLLSSAWILNNVSLASILQMLGLDFDLWFLKSTASNIWDAILRALVCLMQSCDNPGFTRYVSQLVTKANADKKSEDTRGVNFNHMAKEAQYSDSFSMNSRIKFFMDLLAMISSFSFSLCIPGSSTNNRNTTKSNPYQKAAGRTMEQAYCNPYVSPLPQSAVMGKDPDRVNRVLA
jgi:methyl-accepting chemotaxis protein